MAAKLKPESSMSNAQRAKQFMPFAAVKGLETALRRKEQELGLSPPKIMAEEAAAELDAKLHQLQKGCQVRVTYFSAGHYVQSSGRVQAVDVVRQRLFLAEVESIVLTDIIDIERI